MTESNRRRNFIIGLALGAGVPTLGFLIWMLGLYGLGNADVSDEVGYGWLIFGFFGLAVVLPLIVAIALGARTKSRSVGLGMLAGMAILTVISPVACSFIGV